MARVDPQDDSIRRYVVRHYRYDPERHERRDVVVAAFDSRRESDAFMTAITADIARRRAAGEPVDRNEHASTVCREPGSGRLAANGRLVMRALRHGVTPGPWMDELELPRNIGVMRDGPGANRRARAGWALGLRRPTPSRRTRYEARRWQDPPRSIDHRTEEHPMPSARRTITINRPADEVFAFFSNPANDRKWRHHVKEIEAQEPPAVGSKIHQVIAGPGGRGIPADIEVTAYEPPNRYAFKVVAGPARPLGEFTFAPSGAGTDVTFALSAELGGVKKLFMGGPVQKSMDGEMASLDTAKSLIEGA